MQLKLVLCLILLSLLITHVNCWRRRRRSTCATHPRLRDKWFFLDRSRRIFLRVKAHHIVYRYGNFLTVRYRCLQNTGNIYLLKRRKYQEDKDGVLCLGFSYIADHPKAEYAILRLIGKGEGSDLMSPVLVSRSTKLSIESACDLEGNEIQGLPEHMTNAFLRRAKPGCKFPESIRGRWNYTYQHAKSLEIWSKNSTLHLMNGESIKFHCDKRDGKVFVLRASKYPNRLEDSIMCARFQAMPEDPFYNYTVYRHNSGNVLDGILKKVSRARTIYPHVDCDWMDSPARPEFIYP